MKQYRPDSTDSENDHTRNGESLSEYVDRMETEDNLKKLAQKLANDLKGPDVSTRDVSTPDVSTPDVSTPDVSTRDLSFEKFEDRRRRRGDQ